MLHVAADNAAACSLYGACGFTCLRRHQAYYTLDAARSVPSRRRCDALLLAVAAPRSASQPAARLAAKFSWLVLSPSPANQMSPAWVPAQPPWANLTPRRRIEAW